MAGPLAGVTVVALEQAVSAPMCTRTLADLGARVIKVENPRGGDFARHYDDVVHGQAAHFVWANRGKESIALDFTAPDGLAVLHRLLATADVFVANLAPGALARRGLDAAALRQRYPELIALEIDGYGAGGPLSHKRAYDLLIQAESGACAVTGFPGAPAKPGPPVADVTAGLYAAITILALLYRRGGGTASVSLFDTMTELMGYPLTHARYSGTEQPPVGMGSPAVAPYGAYPTADGATVVLGTTNDREWQRLASELLARPELAADPRFASNTGRVAHRAELDNALAAWCAGLPLDEIRRRADAAGIGNAKFNTPAEVNAHPQLAARDRWRPVESPGGTVTALLPPPVIAGWSAPMGAVPALGEHTESILRTAGFTPAEIAALGTAGIAVPALEGMP
ncbi:CaiB/BaiF CoA-transferase family protein [Nocardia sp. NPDC050697]|uniref:CaiB/BaiF CoA transferase family protein n=1 Tax=Nocardia sp. NPDC050697 TaxID=3155158 RepID=UPI0033D3B4DB